MDGGVSNAPPTVERSGQPAQEPPRRGRRLFSRRQDGSVRVYQHSNLLYWWPVWVWGYVCAGVTYLQGIGMGELAASRDKKVLFHPSPWLGISFIGADPVRRGLHQRARARRLLDRAAAADRGHRCGLVAASSPASRRPTAGCHLLRVHLNLAFYLTFSVLLMVIWVFVIFLVDRFTWWRFSPGQVIEEHRVGQATGHAFNTEGMIIQRLPDDLFRHRVLGFGTGDFVVKPASGDTFEIHNVWRANKKQRLLEDMIATRAVKGM